MQKSDQSKVNIENPNYFSFEFWKEAKRMLPWEKMAYDVINIILKKISTLETVN